MRREYKGEGEGQENKKKEMETEIVIVRVGESLTKSTKSRAALGGAMVGDDVEQSREKTNDADGAGTLLTPSRVLAWMRRDKKKGARRSRGTMRGRLGSGGEAVMTDWTGRDSGCAGSRVLVNGARAPRMEPSCLVTARGVTQTAEGGQGGQGGQGTCTHQYASFCIQS